MMIFTHILRHNKFSVIDVFKSLSLFYDSSSSDNISIIRVMHDFIRSFVFNVSFPLIFIKLD